MEDLTKWRSDLLNEDVTVRAAAAEKLCLAGGEATSAAIELVQACGDQDIVSEWAVAALEELGGPPITTLKPLTNLLSEPNPVVAYWAATLLGRLGPDAAPSESELASVLANSQDLVVRERAAWALGQIGVSTDSAIKALSEAAESSNPRLVRLAEAALTPSRN